MGGWAGGKCHVGSVEVGVCWLVGSVWVSGLVGWWLAPYGSVEVAGCWLVEMGGLVVGTMWVCGSRSVSAGGKWDGSVEVGRC